MGPEDRAPLMRIIMKIAYIAAILSTTAYGMLSETGRTCSPDNYLSAWWEKSSKSPLALYTLRTQRQNAGYSYKILTFSEPCPLTFTDTHEITFETKLKRYTLCLSHYGALAHQVVQPLKQAE